MSRVTRIATCFGGATAGVVAVVAALALIGALSTNGAMAAGDAVPSPGATGASGGAATGDDNPPIVQWRLEVVRDGQTIDTFESATTLGQGFSATHHHEVTHRVGCKENPAGGIDLARTISISPIAADVNGVTLSIEANETIEDDTAPSTPEGCALPPQPRRVSASHPGLLIPMGEWAAWTLIDKNPTLVYRVRASVESH